MLQENILHEYLDQKTSLITDHDRQVMRGPQPSNQVKCKTFILIDSYIAIYIHYFFQLIPHDCQSLQSHLSS